MNPIRVALGLSMDASIISAVAALIGAAIGELPSVLASWLTQKTQTRAQWLTHETIAARSYTRSSSKKPQIAMLTRSNTKSRKPAWIELYAKVVRMRVMSSPRVVVSAEHVGQKIIDTYMEPNKTFLEVRELIHTKAIDILSNFSRACREEFESLILT